MSSIVPPKQVWIELHFLTNLRSWCRLAEGRCKCYIYSFHPLLYRAFSRVLQIDILSYCLTLFPALLAKH